MRQLPDFTTRNGNKMKIYKIKRIEEADYGCEERPEGHRRLSRWKMHCCIKETWTKETRQFLLRMALCMHRGGWMSKSGWDFQKKG